MTSFCFMYICSPVKYMQERCCSKLVADVELSASRKHHTDIDPHLSSHFLSQSLLAMVHNDRTKQQQRAAKLYALCSCPRLSPWLRLGYGPMAVWTVYGMNRNRGKHVGYIASLTGKNFSGTATYLKLEFLWNKKSLETFGIL